MFCTQCGKPLNQASRFCPNCGAVVRPNGQNNGNSIPAPPQATAHHAPEYQAPTYQTPTYQAPPYPARTGEKKPRRGWIAVLTAVLVLVAALGTLTVLHLTGHDIPGIPGKNQPGSGGEIVAGRSKEDAEEDSEESSEMAADNRSEAEQTDAILDSMQTVEQVADQYKDENGFVPREKKDDALAACAAAAAGIEGVVSVTQEENCVLIEVEEGPDYVYIPKLEGVDEGEGSLEIITLQPYFSQNLEQDPARNLDHYGLDKCAQNLQRNDTRWQFGTNADDDEVSMEQLLSLDDYQLILWHGHGGYSESKGFFLCTEIRYTGTLQARYPILSRDTAVVLTDGTLCLRPEFFERSYGENAFDNAILYFATCHSGEDAELAEVFLRKGAAAVFANSDTIRRDYNLKMLHMIVDMFCSGEQGDFSSQELQETGRNGWTLGDSLKAAKAAYGDYDYYSSAEVMLYGTGAEELTYPEWMKGFDLPEETEPGSAGTPDPVPASGPVTVDISYVSDTKYDGDTEIYSWQKPIIKVHVPGSKTAEDAINTFFEEMNETNMSYVEYFVEDCETGYSSDYEYFSPGYSTDEASYWISGNLLSVVVAYSEYNTMAVHGYYGIWAYNFDLTTGKQLQLQDIVTNDASIDTLAGLVAERVPQNVLDYGWYSDPNEIAEMVIYPESMIQWYFDDKGMHAYYEIYMIASYADGASDLTVEYDQLEGLIRPEYLN